ncbi:MULTISPECIES: amino acid ABC transporter ATP-binding protein [Vibrio]|jgi:polar amino acid transport system ATP-binding protein/putative glutamine transport system ATP-binding protein|uniref:Amino acid ABC transporter ATP-binding protein n=1 Tax=Vibrio mediterranei TaxID=689 RepID=A0A2S9ZUA3_9VIBR|nr:MULTISPECIES: amino acid ABC transporter ATP-binding protein [Vibrio]AYV22519.1 amino acid ABC transporter ATP-binding protein [Vibrio mediterranei]EDL53608.1 Amino acid transport ATP-binding protein [Vibrio mediterranei AK1]MCF4173228.1 amino acid ABC transporter ATP-binding protein [Vibrio sp. McD22-P3]MCG9658580.1 amino acid ABC transporter ATP-binding protein [Vibrio mediterranei]MCY9854090.1 amino acid ABC transporter ATP-binding protein [Vibrio mediterranei]
MISINNVKKSFGSNDILKGVSLNIEQGDVVSILGASGSGKSTLLRCINGLEAINDGDITFRDLSVSNKAELQKIRTSVSTVFQHFNLYPHLSILDNITLAPIEVLGQSKEQAESTARELLQLVDLADKETSFPAQLSGGQKQRIGICRALAMKPECLLLDEVTSALDPEMTSEVLDVLADLAKSGTTLIFVTHEIAFAKKISNRIVFLDEGVVRADMDKDAFFSDEGGKQDERIRRFLEKMDSK